MIRPNFTRIPAELRALPRWVTWRGAKVPYCPAAINRKASVTNPDTWAHFQMAQTAYEEGGYSGVGFVLSADGIVGIDLDKCVTDGEPSNEALSLMDRIGCNYIELSPSGKGLRGFGYGRNIGGRRGVVEAVRCEVYSDRRYLTVTGHVLRDGPLVQLPGVSEVVDSLTASPTEEAQKMTEELVSHPLFSSVGIPLHTLPNSEGERNRRLFDLARWAKGRCPDATRSELRVLVQEWHRLALPVIGTRDFGTTWADFLRGYEAVRQPHGATLQTILGWIDFAAPTPPHIAALGYGDAGNRLIRICEALQAHAGEAPFFISARQAGELIGMHFTDASKMLSALVADGVIELIQRGAGKVASRYKFLMSEVKQ
ncbi:hypothetical protein NMQ14_03300 [Methyloversatilis sp. XJ19-13]|uniref:hypothetical protein n=1 Tax=Methyloversatilis sp. XJ19-13 TaxID=2963430 RepID=UPI00211CCB71|nr:hypothetical protein [Methyloversatilis sp. XJ19-13]MCQ9373271.1 hypothetical protein [Methyloversatilis sp. XJ19-13]